jgi:hypothetical protein
MTDARESGGLGRVLAGLACGLVAGPLLGFAALIVRSGDLTREYEAVVLADSAASADAVEIRIDGVAPTRRQEIDLPAARLSRLVLFEPHGRRTEGAILEVVRREGGVATSILRQPLDRPVADLRCIVVVTADGQSVRAGDCFSLMRYL